MIENVADLCYSLGSLAQKDDSVKLIPSSCALFIAKIGPKSTLRITTGAGLDIYSSDRKISNFIWSTSSSHFAYIHSSYLEVYSTCDFSQTAILILNETKDQVVTFIGKGADLVGVASCTGIEIFELYGPKYILKSTCKFQINGLHAVFNCAEFLYVCGSNRSGEPVVLKLDCFVDIVEIDHNSIVPAFKLADLIWRLKSPLKSSISYDFSQDETFCLVYCETYISIYNTNDGTLYKTWNSNQLIGENHGCVSFAYFWENNDLVISTSNGRIIWVSVEIGNSQKIRILRESFENITAFACVPKDRLIFKVGDEIICLLQCLPEELTTKFIYEQDLDRAAYIAQTYCIEFEAILKLNWNRTFLKGLQISILTKIYDKRWVFEQCVDCVPNCIDDIRKLLDFGLSMTEGLVKDDIDSEMELLLEGNVSLIEKMKATGWPCFFDQFVFRKTILKHLNLLSTFEVLCGGVYAEIIEEGADISYLFTEFKKIDLLELAIDLARNARINALETLLLRHGSELLPYRFKILDEIPVTVDTSIFHNILPRINNTTGLEALRREIPWRCKDWTSSDELTSLDETILDLTHGKSEDFNIPYPATKDLICHWYAARITFLDAQVGNCDFALNLANFGELNGNHLLGTFIQKLQIGTYLIYGGVQSELISSCDIFSLSPLNSLTVMMNDVKDSDMCAAIINFAIPLLSLPNNFVRGQTVTHELSKYLVNRSKTCTHLGWLKEIVLQSLSTKKSHNSIYASMDELKKLFSDCANISESPDLVTLDVIFDLLQKSEDSAGWNEAFDIDMDQIDSETDTLRKQLNILRLLALHGFKSCISHLHVLEGDLSAQHLLLHRITKHSICLNDSIETWFNMLDDLLKMRNLGLFALIPKSDVIQSICFAALAQARIRYLIIEFKFARAILFPENSLPPLSNECAEKMVIEVSREFFANAGTNDEGTGFINNAVCWYFQC